MDYKRALRELAERQHQEAEGQLIGTEGDGRGPVPGEEQAPYAPADGHQEKSDAAGVPGQYEDAATAADRAAQEGQPEQAEGEAGERVLPSHG